MLLPFLLTQHKVWRYCKMRIFTVSRESYVRVVLYFFIFSYVHLVFR